MSEAIADPFDRVLGEYTGLPGHLTSKPTTVAVVWPMLGGAKTYVIRTVRTPDNHFLGFVEMIESGGHVRFVIPSMGMAALYRQREALITRARKSAARERYALEHPGWSPKRKERKPRRKKAART